MPEEMTNRQIEQLEKFKKFTRWMYGDAKEAMFCARANFLVAMSLFNYIETLGTFLTGFFQKDARGSILKDSKGRNLRIPTRDRFNAFLGYLGQEYATLLSDHPEVYDELRCGLTHEYLPKNRDFCIYGLNQRYADADLHHLENPLDRSRVTCGIRFFPYNQDGVWQIFVGKLLIDFEEGAKKLATEVEIPQNQALIDRFFEVADQINLERFG